MYCSASATLWIRSSWRIVAMLAPIAGSMRAVVPRALVARPRRRHDAIDGGDRERRHEERDVDAGLRDQHLRLVRLRVDERLEQMNRRDADDRGRELHLERARVDVRQPLRLVGMTLEVHP